MVTNVPFLRASKIRDREIESVLTFVIKLLVESNLPSDTFTKLIADLTKILQTFQQAINRERKNELTAEIRDTDELRKKHFKTFLRGIDYFISMSGTPMEEAALVLEKVVDKHGKAIIRESDIVETVKLRAMLKDLAETEEAAAIETLAMSKTVDALNSSNEYFDVLYLKRTTNEAEDETPTLIPMRKMATDSFHLLVYLINFYNRIEPEIYGGVAGELAELFGNIMTVAKARQTRNAHEDEEIEEEEDLVEEEILG